MTDDTPTDSVYIALQKRLLENLSIIVNEANKVGVAVYILPTPPNLNYPPLAGSEWVLNESPNWVIAIVLKGLMGPIEVKGETYNNVMAAQGGGLSDEDLANVITYIRRNADWGNDPNLPLVTSDQVKSVREEIDARTSMFTVEDLLKLYPKN